MYALDGTDDRGGAAQAASLAGVALLNPHGSVICGLTTAMPRARLVHLAASAMHAPHLAANSVSGAHITHASVATVDLAAPLLAAFLGADDFESIGLGPEPTVIRLVPIITPTAGTVIAKCVRVLFDAEPDHGRSGGLLHFDPPGIRCPPHDWNTAPRPVCVRFEGNVAVVNASITALFVLQ